ncbi:MAG: hypothetical protein N2559_17460 [Anaerolineae bacterium]|nr:hypothetical protein [Anaerolineae bacterium]
MTKRIGKKESSAGSKNNGLGPVAREKYEAILKNRVRECIAAQEAKLKAERTNALKVYLERNELAGTLRQYRTALEALIAVLGESYYRELCGTTRRFYKTLTCKKAWRRSCAR